MYFVQIYVEEMSGSESDMTERQRSLSIYLASMIFKVHGSNSQLN